MKKATLRHNLLFCKVVLPIYMVGWIAGIFYHVLNHRIFAVICGALFIAIYYDFVIKKELKP